MATELYNFETKKLEKVEDVLVKDSILSGKYGMLKGARVPVVNPYGEPGTIPSEKAHEALAQGWEYDTEADRENRKKEIEYGKGVTNDLIAGTLGAARGLTFGLSDQILAKTGVLDPEDLSEYEKRNPIASGIGEVGSIIATTALSGGTSLAGKALGAAGKGVLAVDKASRLAGTVGKSVIGRKVRSELVQDMVKVGIIGATEGAAYAAGDIISEDAMGNAELGAESLISAMTMGAVVGGGLTAGLLGGSKVTFDGVKKVNKAAGKSIRKLFGMGDELNPVDTLKSLRTADSQVTRKGSYLSFDIDDNGAYKVVSKKDGIDLEIEPSKLSGRVFNQANERDLDELGELFGIDKFSEIPGLESVSTSTLSFKIGQELKRKAKDKGATPLFGGKKDPLENIKDAKTLARVVRDKIDNYLDGFDVIVRPDPRNGRVHVKDPSVIQDAIKKMNLPEGKLSFADEKTLRFAGFKKREFARYSDKEKTEFAGYVRRNFNNQGRGVKSFFTELDDVQANILESKAKSIADLGVSVEQAQQEIIKNMSRIPEGKLLTAKKVKDYIYDTYLKPNEKFVKKKVLSVDELGNETSRVVTTKVVEDSFQDAHAKLKKLADNWEEFYSVEDDILGHRPAILSIEDFRDMRLKLDKTIKNWDANLPAHKDILKDVRTFMEDEIIKVMDFVDEGSGISQKYRAAKKEYRFAKTFEKIVNDEVARQAANNSIPLTGYILAGGMLSHSGVGLGAVAAAGGRYMWKRYGDSVLALAADKMHSHQVTKLKAITKSVSGFLSSGKTPLKSGLVNFAVGKYTKDDLEKARDRYEEFVVNYEATINRLGDDLELIKQIAPKTSDFYIQKVSTASDFLVRKMPKNPHDTLSFKEYQPSDSEVRKFSRYLAAVEKPKTILDNLKNGYVSSEEVEVLREVFPATFIKLQEEFIDQIKDRKLTYKQRQLLNKLFAINTDQAFKPNNLAMLQAPREGIQQAAPRGMRLQKADSLSLAGNTKTKTLGLQER